MDTTKLNHFLYHMDSYINFKKAGLNELPQKIPEVYEENFFVLPNQNLTFYVHRPMTDSGRHRHNFIEMVYVVEGSFHQVFDDGELIMTAGDLCILDTNTYHRIKQTGPHDLSVNCLMRKQYFDYSFLSRLSGQDLLSKFLIQTIYENKGERNYLYFNTAGNKTIQQLMTTLLCEYFDPGLGTKEIQDAYMVILFSELMRHYHNQLHDKSTPSYHYKGVPDVLSTIQQEYKTITLSELSARFGFSVPHMSRLLKKAVGKNFKDMIQELKLENVAILLETTDTAIDVLIKHVGYTNVHHFYELFKSTYHMTPATYRQKFRT